MPGTPSATAGVSSGITNARSGGCSPSRVKGKHRWHLLLKSKKSTPLLEVGRQLVNWGYGEFKGFGVNLTADVDPISLI